MPNPHYVWPNHVLTLSQESDPLVSVADIKPHCRIDHSDDDAYLTSLIAAAQAVIDGPYGMVGKAIATQQWTLTQSLLTGKTRLPIPVLPFRDVVSLKYYDANNVQQTIDLSADFVVFGNEDFGYIEPLVSWPAMYDRPDAIELVFHAGFGDVADCPQNLIHAVKMLVAHWYENRETVVDYSVNNLPMAVQELVNIHRIGWIKS
jgi:uncharacterized phiE125 gp8 family phage protein